MNAITCRYERRNNRIIGRCEEYGLETLPHLGRLECEEELIALVLKLVGERNKDDVIFVHGATVEMADA